MTFQVFDRLKEVVTTSGTGSFTAPGTGVATGFRALSTIGDGNTHFYVATDFGSNWEVGLGTYAASGTLFARTTIYASSNAGAAVNFSTPPTVFGDMPATWFLNPTPLSLLITGIGGAGFVNFPTQSSALATPPASSFNFGSNTTGQPQFRLSNGFAFNFDLSLIGASRTVQFNSVTGIAVVTSTPGITRLGALSDVAAPVAQTVTVPNVVAGTSNTAGQPVTYCASQGTGTGIGGSFIIQVAPAGSTGSTQNALVTALTIDSTKQATFAGAIASSAPTPSIAAGIGAGTGPTIAIAGGPNGGRITLTTGTLPTISAIVATITYANAFGTDSYASLTPANANAAGLSGTGMVFPSSSASNFTITSGAAGLVAATQYIWNYTAIGK